MDTKVFAWAYPSKSNGLRHSEGADNACLRCAQADREKQWKEFPS